MAVPFLLSAGREQKDRCQKIERTQEHSIVAERGKPNRYALRHLCRMRSREWMKLRSGI
jgi:hypothetical protein